MKSVLLVLMALSVFFIPIMALKVLIDDIKSDKNSKSA